MSTHAPAVKPKPQEPSPKPSYRLYPAYCFRASRTYDTWVKLTAADIQALRAEPDFQSQHIYFHLNHPIRYVRLVGVVVAIDDINVKYTVLTIDDGSGATIEVKIVRVLPEGHVPGALMNAPEETKVQNVRVRSRVGVFEVVVDGNSVDVGTVLKIKGTIDEFRGQKQLEMQRVWIMKTTNEEVKAWKETADFKRDVLSVPWHISSSEHRKIKAEIKMERRKNQEIERLRAEHELKKQAHRKKWEGYIAHRETKLEMRRRKEEIMMNQGALI